MCATAELPVEPGLRVDVEPLDRVLQRAAREIETGRERREVVGAVEPRRVGAAGSERPDRGARPVRPVEDEPTRRGGPRVRPRVEPQHRAAGVGVVLGLVDEPTPGAVDHDRPRLGPLVVQRPEERCAADLLARNPDRRHPPRVGHVPERGAHTARETNRVTRAPGWAHRRDLGNGQERAHERGVVLEATGGEHDVTRELGGPAADAAHARRVAHERVHPLAGADLDPELLEREEQSRDEHPAAHRTP